MASQRPIWLIPYAFLAGIGFTVLFYRTWTTTPPIEFVILASYGYMWGVVTLAGKIAAWNGDIDTTSFIGIFETL